MDITDVRCKKRDLARNISALIDAFEAETKTDVDSIELSHEMGQGADGIVWYHVASIKVDIL